MRGIDTVSRFGGDEFAILVSDITGKQDVTALTEVIQRLLSEPFDIENHHICISASIGSALYPEDGNDVEAMLHKADAGMYSTKNNIQYNQQVTTS